MRVAANLSVDRATTDIAIEPSQKKVESQKEPESKRESNELYEIEEEILKTKLQQLKLLKK